MRPAFSGRATTCLGFHVAVLTTRGGGKEVCGGGGGEGWRGGGLRGYDWF